VGGCDVAGALASVGDCPAAVCALLAAATVAGFGDDVGDCPAVACVLAAAAVGGFGDDVGVRPAVTCALAAAAAAGLGDVGECPGWIFAFCAACLALIDCAFSDRG
jgi:hypothetical protein